MSSGDAVFRRIQSVARSATSLALSHGVTCNIVSCHLPATAYDDIANGCGNKACGRSKSGFRT